MPFQMVYLQDDMAKRKQNNSKIILGFLASHRDINKEGESIGFISNPRKHLAKRAHVEICTIDRRLAACKRPDKMSPTLKGWFIAETDRLCRDGEPNPIQEILNAKR